MQIQMDKDLRFIFEVLPAFGTRYSNLVMAYCCLFGVTPFQIKAKKLRLILEEMKRLFDAEAFNYQKKLYPISHAGIAEALDLCIKKNFEQHLENHNYLKKVMIGISEREAKNQSKAAEKNLKIREQHLLAGGGRNEDAGPDQKVKDERTPVEDLPEDVRKGIDALKEKLGMNKISKKTEDDK
jgi:hypothetical protein